MPWTTEAVKARRAALQDEIERMEEVLEDRWVMYLEPEYERKQTELEAVETILEARGELE